jgi:hypothetical protein
MVHRDTGGTAVIEKLTRHGDCLALIIDKGVLDLLDTTADTPLAVETGGRGRLR